MVGGECWGRCAALRPGRSGQQLFGLSRSRRASSAGRRAGQQRMATLASQGLARRIDDASFGFASAAVPVIRLLDPESAHRAAVLLGKYGLTPKQFEADSHVLRCSLWGKSFSNPVGLAAGFDKNAEAMHSFLRMGFGFVEIGSVTPKPQPGNPKPRVFRLEEEKAIINRYGFNSDGVAVVEERLKEYRDTPNAGLLGVNLGKNKATEDASSDYLKGVQSIGMYGDYIVVNVSSPNTPGLRSLQKKDDLRNLLRVVRDEVATISNSEQSIPLVLKIAPDLGEEDLEDIAEVALEEKIDGIIISNSTVMRPPSVQKLESGNEAGGLSGLPLLSLSTQLLRKMYILTKGTIPLIGCGGVSDGKSAYEKIKNGASLVQLYTSLVYKGPSVVLHTKRQLADLIVQDGFANIAEAVGSGVDEK